jgi:Cu+-exporting ATPase
MEVLVNTTSPDLQSDALAEKYQNAIKLYCDGITCHSCVDVIRHSLRDVPSIQTIDVDIPNKIVYISGANPPLGRIIEEIETFGFSITILSRGSGALASVIPSPLPTPIVTPTASTTPPEATVQSAKPDNSNQQNNHSSSSSGNSKSDKSSSDGSVIVPLNASAALTIVEKANFAIEGMTCASCVTLIETMARDIPGIITISVNLLASKAAVTYDAKITAPEKICEEITDIGFKTTEIMALKPGMSLFLCIFSVIFFSLCRNDHSLNRRIDN